MVLAAGALSQVSVRDTGATLLSAAASGGTGPYTYQWYRSTTTGFSPGGGNIISGATSLTLVDSGLVPGTNYFYKVVATDTGDSNVTANSSQLAVTTSVGSGLSQNQFAQKTVVGEVDMRFAFNTVSMQVDFTEAGALYAGSAVKLVPSTAGGVPRVIGITADTDAVFGIVNYNTKNRQFLAGDIMEVSQDGNYIYMVSTGAITQGANVCIDQSVTKPGGVVAVTGSSGFRIIGYAYDGAAAAGELIRVVLRIPGTALDA